MSSNLVRELREFAEYEAIGEILKNLILVCASEVSLQLRVDVEIRMPTHLKYSAMCHIYIAGDVIITGIICVHQQLVSFRGLVYDLGDPATISKLSSDIRLWMKRARLSQWPYEGNKT